MSATSAKSARNRIRALLLAALLALGCAGADDGPRVDAGVLDLSGWQFESQGIVSLVGEWEICWGALVEPDPRSEACPTGGADGRWQNFPVPRLWSDSGVSSPIGGKGVATYRARIALPPDAGPLVLHVGSPLTAYRLWLNGAPHGGVGTVSIDAASAVAKLADRDYSVSAALPDPVPQLEVLVQVSNHEFRGGGLRRIWYLGLDQQVATRNGYELLLYTSFMSTSVIIGLVFLAQFAFRPSERARGWLGLFAVLVGLRIIPASTSELYQLMGGWASFALLLRLEYANTALLIFAAAGYLGSKVPDVVPVAATRVLQLTALALVPIHLLAPLETVLATLPVILALPPLVILLAVVSYGRAWWRGREGVGSTLLVTSIFGLGVVHDVVRTQTGLGAPIELFPYFVVFSIALESSSLLRSFARSLANVERLSSELQESNFELQETEEAVVRFVPFDVLRTLGKQSVRDVRPGIHATAEMTVLSCVLEADGADHFSVVNEFVSRAGGIVQARGGFFSQQLGDRMVALFPGEADEALASALEIQEVARGLGRVRIGIASGPVILGAVGGEDSLSGVALGATVSAAHQLMEETRSQDVSVLVSGSTRDRLRDPSRHPLRAIAANSGADPATVFALRGTGEGPDKGAGESPASAAG